MSTVPCKVNGKQGRYLSSTPKACACFELQVSSPIRPQYKERRKERSLHPASYRTLQSSRRHGQAEIDGARSSTWLTYSRGAMYLYVDS